MKSVNEMRKFEQFLEASINMLGSIINTYSSKFNLIHFVLTINPFLLLILFPDLKYSDFNNGIFTAFGTFTSLYPIDIRNINITLSSSCLLSAVKFT